MSAAAPASWGLSVAIRQGVLLETDRLMDALTPLDPPSWQVRGGDPVAVLELERANRRLRAGARPRDVAFGLALTCAAREHGADLVRDATRSLVDP